MSRFESAERIAQLIHAGRESDIFESERMLLEHDQEFHAIVDAIVQAYRQSALLRDGEVRSDSTLGGNLLIATTVWMLPYVRRQAMLWGRDTHRGYVLEIKEWPFDAREYAAYIGTHSLVYQQSHDKPAAIVDAPQTHSCPESGIAHVRTEVESRRATKRHE